MLFYSLILCGFLLLTMFVVFSFNCSDNVLIDEIVQALILVFSLVNLLVLALTFFFFYIFCRLKVLFCSNCFGILTKYCVVSVLRNYMSHPGTQKDKKSFRTL